MCCTVGKCCCCIRLRTGVIAIGCVLLVGDALLLAWTSYVTHGTNMALQQLLAAGYEYRDMSDLFPIGIFCLLLAFDVIHSVAILLHIMLLVGAITGRPRLLFGWVVAYAVLYALFLVVNILDLVVSYPFVFSSYYGLCMTAGFLVHAGLAVYFWTVVRSYYLELDQQHRGSCSRSAAGQGYQAVYSGGVLPAHDTHGDEEGGFLMGPTAPPPYTAYAKDPQRRSHYWTVAVGTMR